MHFFFGYTLIFKIAKSKLRLVVKQIPTAWLTVGLGFDQAVFTPLCSACELTVCRHKVTREDEQSGQVPWRALDLA